MLQYTVVEMEYLYRGLIEDNLRIIWAGSGRNIISAGSGRNN